MKKIILGTTLIASCLLADVKTILPYVGTIDYGNDSSKSFKNRATLLGFHASVGNLSYLTEFDYSHINTSYKDSTNSDLKQDDITLVYGKYYTNYMYRVGMHYISTNDIQLKNGIIAIASVGAYNYYGYDKLSYGLEGYYSYYNKGHDENYAVVKSIGITQFTPYVSFYKAVSPTLGNTISLKANYQIASDYVDSSYSSFELSDTLAYKSFFTTIQVYNGDTRTLVKDSGMTVFNTLDLMKGGWNLKLGYYFRKDIVATISYGENTYREFEQSTTTITQDNTNKIAVASLNYSY